LRKDEGRRKPLGGGKVGGESGSNRSGDCDPDCLPRRKSITTAGSELVPFGRRRLEITFRKEAMSRFSMQGKSVGTESLKGLLLLPLCDGGRTGVALGYSRNGKKG